MPTTLTALAGAEGALAAPISDLQAQIDGTVAASASVAIQPPSLDLAAALEAAAALPGVQVSVDGLAALALSLGVELGALQAALALVVSLKGPFAVAGIYAWELDGEVGGMGADLGGQLAGGAPGGGGPTAHGTALVLLAQDAGAIAALKTLFAL